MNLNTIPFPRPVEPEALLTLTDMAKWFGKSRSWVRDHASGRNRPQLPCVKIGKTLLFERIEVEAWLRKMRVAA